jgi:outer membrane biosynthesis protein TonB
VNDRCARTEVLAGAIALDEASAVEREEYRNHLATCVACVDAFGGERAIERTMAVVAEAKAGETWEPLPRALRSRAHVLPLRAAAVAVAAAVVLAPQLVAVERMAAAPVYNVSLEHRTEPAPPVPVQHIIVVHNVVTRSGISVTQRTTTQSTQVADAQPIAQATAPASNVPIWRRDEALPSQQSVQPVFSGHAESMVIQPQGVSREAMPVGGDAAIQPRPSPIAYAENAQGTTAFEVAIDERGAPVKCTITKSSGWRVLDGAVCRAAMIVRYAPRLVSGRASAGVYRDAFTFRDAGDDEEDIGQTPRP